MVLPLAGRAKYMCSGVAALPLPRMTSRIVRPARRTKCASTGRVTEAPEPIIVQRLATPEVEADAQHLLSRFRLRPHPSTGRELLTKGRISLAASHASGTVFDIGDASASLGAEPARRRAGRDPEVRAVAHQPPNVIYTRSASSLSSDHAAQKNLHRGGFRLGVFAQQIRQRS